MPPPTPRRPRRPSLMPTVVGSARLDLRGRPRDRPRVPGHATRQERLEGDDAGGVGWVQLHPHHARTDGPAAPAKRGSGAGGGGECGMHRPALRQLHPPLAVPATVLRNEDRVGVALGEVCTRGPFVEALRAGRAGRARPVRAGGASRGAPPATTCSKACASGASTCPVGQCAAPWPEWLGQT